MKILVRDDAGSTLGAIQVRIKDLSSELERITVRVFGLQRLDSKSQKEQKRTTERKHFQHTVFSRLLQTIQPTSRATPPPVTPDAAATKTVEIKIGLPSWPKLFSPAVLKQRLARTSQKTRIAAGIICAVIVVFGVYSFWLHPRSSHGNTAQASGVSALTHGTPDYATILPAGKNIESLGGWTRISPPGSAPVYTYVDKIGDVQVNVSEQPLPANFQHDTADQIAQLAQGFSASDKLMAGDTALYVGTSAKGPQSVILSKAKLLILIKSTAPVADSQWAAYVSSLH